MRVVIRPLLCILFLCISSPCVLATQANSNYPLIRRASSAKINSYHNDKDFMYQREYVPASNFWDRVKRWIIDHLFGPLLKNHSITLWDIILYAIAATAIILIVYYFIKSDKVGLFSRHTGNTFNITSADENIHELDFDNLISGAASNAQYRVATRYLYLKSLKALSVRGLILWKADKTNRDYINELRLSSVGKLFSEVTYLFNYAWYGNMDINEISYLRIKDAFDKFNLQIQASQ